MIGARYGNACDRHVIVANCLDLLYTRVFGQPVELAEQLVEAADNLVGLHARGDLAESDDVGEEHSGILVMIGDDAFAVSQPAGKLGGKDVSQESLGIPLFLFDSG